MRGSVTAINRLLAEIRSPARNALMEVGDRRLKRLWMRDPMDRKIDRQREIRQQKIIDVSRRKADALPGAATDQGVTWRSLEKGVEGAWVFDVRVDLPPRTWRKREDKRRRDALKGRQNDDALPMTRADLT